MDVFDGYLLSFLNGLSTNDNYKIASAVKNWNLKKNDIYLCEGEVNRKVFYIRKGILRGYLLNEKGEEKTITLIFENEFGSDYNCFLERKPARLTWAAIEDTEILEIDYEILEKFGEDSVSILNLIITFLQKIMLRNHKRIENFVIYSPEERYVNFCKSTNGLHQNIPDKYIASYLGITPVSLSRIKKRITN